MHIGARGGDKMIYFDKNLENIALKIVKENWDEIKAEKDLQEIIRVINGIKSNINISLYIKEGIDLNERLRREYLEIQQMYEIISNIPSNSTGNIQVKNYSALSYAGIMFNSSKANETTRKMLASLYLYWKTAKEYFN